MEANPTFSDLSNKIALITGASSGLGRAIAISLAAAGAFVVSADLTALPPTAAIFTESMKNSGIDISTPTVEYLNQKYPLSSQDGNKTRPPRSIFVQCNVTDPASVKNAIKSAVQQYGRLDIMINNAGISAGFQSRSFQNGSRCRIHEVDDDVFDQDVAVNVRGVWLGMKHAAAQILSQSPLYGGDRGWIINICSIMGIVANGGAASYCASKGAVLQMTKAVALDYARDGIHVNCVAPGWMETAMLEPLMAKEGGAAQGKAIRDLHPWGRMAKTSEVAAMVVFLAGPGASFCTGQAFVVDGGYTAQ